MLFSSGILVGWKIRLQISLTKMASMAAMRICFAAGELECGRGIWRFKSVDFLSLSQALRFYVVVPLAEHHHLQEDHTYIQAPRHEILLEV
jgi:hypothetical protein